MIHPSAIVSDDAELDSEVEVGPFAIIEGAPKIATGCRILAHAQIVGDVEIGPETTIGRGAVIGEDPQDVSFDVSVSSGVRIGKGNVIREYCTIHRGSQEGAMTRVGESNFLMAGTHLGHDVIMGTRNVIANNCLLGGYVEVGDGAFLGGGAAFHQFVRLGDGCLVQGNSAISKDIPPFCIAARLNELHGLNIIGLRRLGADNIVRAELKRAYQLVFNGQMPLRAANDAARSSEWGEMALRFFAFLRDNSKKGVCFPKS